MSLLVTALGSVVYAKFLVRHIGADAFGWASLIIAAMWILPVLVDGTRTFVVNNVASQYSQPSADQLAPKLHRAARVQLALGVACLLVTLISVLAVWFRTAQWTWALLTLGVGASLAIAAAASPASGVLQGLGYQTLLSLLPIASTFASIVLLLLLSQLHFGVGAATAAPVGGAIVAVATYIWVVRRWRLPVASLGDLLHRSGQVRMAVARPATTFTAVSVLFFMVDRYVIGARGDAAVLAGFVVVQQLTTPLMALTSSVGDGLWAYVEGQRGAHPEKRQGVIRVIALAGLIGTVLGLGVLAASKYLVQFILGEPTVATGELAWIMAVLVAASGFSSGAASLLRRARGLRAMTKVWSIALVLKVAAESVAASHMGSIGGLATGVAIYVLAVVATTILALRLVVVADLDTTPA